MLGLQELGQDDNFFELGGDSVLLSQAHSRLKEQFPSLELVDLFKYSSIRTLARFLSGANPEEPAAAQASGQPAKGETDIAVIGMACRFPEADSIDEFWKNLKEGREAIRRFSRDELLEAGFDPKLVDDPRFVPASPTLRDAAGFDAGFFGLSAREAECMDPQHRLFLECAWEAFEDAGIVPQAHPGRIGAFVAASMNTYFVNNVLPKRQELDAQDPLTVFTLDSLGGFQSMVANDKDFIGMRVSYKLDLRGPSINVQTACSSGLVAIHLAAKSILSGDCDMALAGAASVQSPQAAGHLYQEGMLVSPDGHCRAFDAQAGGTIFGSGVGAVLLKPLARAIADGDAVYAVIKGSAVNNDGGQKLGYLAPSGEGGSRAARDALAAARVPAHGVGFVEAHGTGTLMGDPIEFASMASVYDAPSRARQSCVLGSVKTNLGHLEIASGTVGFMKAALAVYHGEIPASLHFAQANPALHIEQSPFRINTRLEVWKSPSGQPRRAGVNSLGIGGTNAHVILEEPPVTEVPAPLKERPLHLLCLSARSEAALAQLGHKWLRYIETHPQASPGDLCHTANAGRRHFPSRRAHRFADLPELLRQLQAEEVGQPVSSQAKPLVFRIGQLTRRTAGMAEFLETAPQFQESLRALDEVLLEKGIPSLISALSGASPWPDDPAFRKAGSACLALAAADLLAAWNVYPDRIAGGRLGEAISACLSGALPFPALVDQVLEGTLEADCSVEGVDDAFVLKLPEFGWAELLDFLKGAYLVGKNPDWQAFDKPYARRKLHLPTYPFEHRRYWIEPAAPRETPRASLHPLLDTRIESPLLPGLLCETKLDTKRHPLLSDHLLYGRPVISGSCHVSLVLGAAGEKGPLLLEDVEFPEALVLPPGGATLQLELRRQKGQPSRFRLISLADDDSVSTHAAGTLRPSAGSPKSGASVIAPALEECPQRVDLQAHYHQLEARHIHLGSSYRWMSELRIDAKGSAFCRLSLPSCLSATQAEAYGIHPGLLDAGFGLLVAAVPLSVEDTFVPAGARSLTLWQTALHCT